MLSVLNMHCIRILTQIGCYFLFITKTFVLCHDSKIIGGRAVTYGEFPFIASVTKWSKGFLETICGGGILNRNFVISACSCFVRFSSRHGHVNQVINTETFMVIGGSILFVEFGDPFVGEQSRKIEFLFVSPKCRKSPLFGVQFNFAVLKVNRPFKYNTYVAPMPLYSTNRESLKQQYHQLSEIKTNCSVMGWGATKLLGLSLELYDRFSSILKRTTVRLLNEQRCFDFSCLKKDSLSFCPEKFNKSGSICTKSIKGSDACNRDRGAPLICNDYVLGFVSSGGCNRLYQTTYYQSLYSIIGFLQKLGLEDENV